MTATPCQAAVRDPVGRIRFGDDRIRHPALRRLLEEHHRTCSEREHAELATEREVRAAWERFFELNPELTRP